MRIQEYGVGLFAERFTKSALKKALKKQHVKVNGEPATTATWIRGGETIELIVPEEKRSGKEVDLDLQVLYEDVHLALVFKPAGVLVSGNAHNTVARALSFNLAPSGLSDATRPQPVHRLDYPTSGVLLAGKTSSSIRALSQLFAARKVAKTYYAITIGLMEKEGIINRDVDGKPAASSFVVEQSVASGKFGRLNLVRLRPHTGRRHQLRKHLAALGNPILGDREYGKEGLVLKGKGLYLHAHSLEFVHPFTGEEFRIEAELPRKFGKIFARAGE